MFITHCIIAGLFYGRGSLGESNAHV